MATKKAKPVKKAVSKKPTPQKAVNPFISNPSSKVNQDICARFRQVREEQGITQKLFSEMLGVNVEYIKKVEQGHFAPSHGLIKQVAKTFKISVDWIFNMYGD